MTALPGDTASSDGTSLPDTLIIQFARTPQVGSVKTRMIPLLGARGACALHRELVFWTCKRLVAAQLGDVELWVTGRTDHADFLQCLELGVNAIHAQQGAGLGERMHHAMVHGLARYSRVLLVGSDCPEIDTAYLSRALSGLQLAPVVIGPAADGGYVLLAASEIDSELFRDIAWGHSTVFASTCERMRSQGIAWQALPVKCDIDRPEDLPLWEALRGRRFNIKA